MSVVPRIPGGFLELLPEEQIVFNNLYDIIRKGYELYGFTPLDTPMIEYEEVLLAKTAGETSRQIFKKLGIAF